MKKQFLSLFLILVLLCSLTNVSASYDILEEQVLAANTKSNLCDEMFANIYTKLDLEKMYQSNAPEDYAGIYADENGNLVLCSTTGNSEKYKKVVNSIIANKAISYDLQEIQSDNGSVVKIEERKFPYNYLNTIQDALDPNMIEFKIQKTAIKQEKNTVDITVADETSAEGIINYLNEAVPSFNSESINIIVSDYETVVPTANYAYNGVKIYHALFASDYGTLGFNGSYTDSYGRVHYGVFTNAHVAPAGKKMKISALKTVGTTLFSYAGGSLDVAFVEFDSGWNLTDKMLSESDTNSIYCSATADEFYEGALTNKYGAKTGKQSGKILSTSITVQVDYDDITKTITDVFEFSNKTEGGDSGGPVGKQQVRQVFKLYGITFAGPENSNECGYGIKLSNIKKAYNIKVYGTNGWS